jgi:pseudouridine-5'-phosphate glycosidase
MVEQLTMVVDATITIGNIVEITVLAIGGIGAISAIRSSVGNMKNDLTDLKSEIKKVGEVLIKMAVTDQRLMNIEEDIRDLQRGEGKVLPLNKSAYEIP